MQMENTDLPSMNKDIILTVAGDRIYCKITRVTDYEIYYTVNMPGADRKLKIDKVRVKEYKCNQVIFTVAH